MTGALNRLSDACMSNKGLRPRTMQPRRGKLAPPARSSSTKVSRDLPAFQDKGPSTSTVQHKRLCCYAGSWPPGIPAPCRVATTAVMVFFNRVCDDSGPVERGASCISFAHWTSRRRLALTRYRRLLVTAWFPDANNSNRSNIESVCDVMSKHKPPFSRNWPCRFLVCQHGGGVQRAMGRESISHVKQILAIADAIRTRWSRPSSLPGSIRLLARSSASFLHGRGEIWISSQGSQILYMRTRPAL